MAEWYRAPVARGFRAVAETESRVDRENEVIRGASIVTKGMAKGHGVELDDEFLGQVLKSAQAKKPGVKVRFDHPMASSTSMGTLLGRAKNFSLDGGQVFADIHLSETAHDAPQGDIADYVMSLAENEPDMFGVSIVFDQAPSKVRLNEDGTRKNGTDGKPLPRLARLKDLLAADVVDDPAANSGGLFTSMADTPAAQAAAFLDRYCEDRGINLNVLSAAVGRPEVHKGDNVMSEKTTAADYTEFTQSADYKQAIKDARTEAFSEGQEDGVKGAADDQRAHVLKFAKEFADRPAFALDQLAKGNDLATAKAELSGVLATELAAKDDEIAQLRADAGKIPFAASDNGTTKASKPGDEDALRREYDALPDGVRSGCSFESYQKADVEEKLQEEYRSLSDDARMTMSYSDFKRQRPSLRLSDQKGGA